MMSIPILYTDSVGPLCESSWWYRR